MEEQTAINETTEKVFNAIKQIADGRVYHTLSLPEIQGIVDLPAEVVGEAINELSKSGKIGLVLMSDKQVAEKS